MLDSLPRVLKPSLAPPPGGEELALFESIEELRPKLETLGLRDAKVFNKARP